MSVTGGTSYESIINPLVAVPSLQREFMKAIYSRR